MMGSVSSFVLMFCIACCVGLSPQCRDERGEPVDWFYLYKLPRVKNHINPLIRRGVAYMYITPSNLTGGWIMSDLAIADPNSMLGRTLAPLYQDPSSTLSVIYNDQPPLPPGNGYQSDRAKTIAKRYTKSKQGQFKHSNTKKYRRFKLSKKYYDHCYLAKMCNRHTEHNMKAQVESGHTKGVLLGDNVTSLWLVHSVPKFPPVPDRNTSYSYPITGMKFGQSMLCVSVQTSTVNQIATQLKYNEPLIVYHNVSSDIANELPNLIEVLKNKTVDSAPWHHIQDFETLGGHKFLSFAKSAMFHDDLYSGLVAEVLQSDLLVESWTNGPGTLDSECKRKFQVRNIESLKSLTAKLSFTSHHDHSKWAVAVAQKRRHSGSQDPVHWVCVGDINRAIPQESRGGGTVCTSGPDLWGNFAHLIETAQTCN